MAAGEKRTAPCEILDWDSAFFGFGVARALGRTLDDASSRAIDEWCRGRTVGCLYLLAEADDAVTADVAKANGYRAVSVRLTMRHDLDPLPDRDPRALLRDADPGDIPALRALAARSFTDSRFYSDPGFERARCDELYALWIETGIRDPERWVLTAVVEGVPVGFQLITPAVNGGTARMELLAVDDGHRREGLGRALLSDGLRRAREHGAVAVETATQQQNALSVDVHRSLGFSVVRGEVWYHKWFR